MRRLGAIVGAATALVLLADAAAARTVCMPRGELLGWLAVGWDERPAAAGLSGDGRVYELVMAVDRSWSLVVTYPEGTSCLIASGRVWVSAAPPGEPM